MENSIDIIKQWLGTGSINVFGLPFSGKDTVGVRLAELLNGKFLSSGMIFREMQERDAEMRAEMKSGALVDTNKFLDIILPYFGINELKNYPLVLSSVGRWSGEEFEVMHAAEHFEHPIKACILLNISEAEVEKRRLAAQADESRGRREDDANAAAMEKRFQEFAEKTMPVINTYREKGLLIPVQAVGTKDEVFNNVINSLLEFIKNQA